MGKKTRFHVSSKEAKEIVSLIEKMSYKFDTYQLFEDFLEMSAIAISNQVDWVHEKEREEQYLKIIKRYSKEELDNFPKMLVHLTMALKDGWSDVLGEVFHALGLHNKYRGQFFTPFNVCVMMAKMLFGNIDEQIEKKGYLTMYEPCCGAGAMIIGAAKAIEDSGYDYKNQFFTIATDIDKKCVLMCYLQLALLGIPAVVIHGDSLTNKRWDTWYTPGFMLNEKIAFDYFGINDAEKKG